MNSAKTVTAGFEANPPNTFALTILATNGTVKKTPDKPQYDSGSTVGLKATPGTGYYFVNWTGDVAGTSDSVNVVMNSAKSVTANFSKIQCALTMSNDSHGTTTPATGTLTGTWYGDGVQLVAGIDYTPTKNVAIILKNSLLSVGQHTFYCVFSNGVCSKSTSTETVTVNPLPSN